MTGAAKMDNQTEPVEPKTAETSRPAWQKPELMEVAIGDVTASIFATSGNDGTFGFSNVS